MTDITLDTSNGFGNAIGGGDMRFHLPGMTAGALVVQIFFYNTSAAYRVTITDSYFGVVKDESWGPFFGNYLGWTEVYDGEVVIEVNGPGGYSIGWGNSSMDTNPDHWGHAPEITWDQSINWGRTNGHFDGDSRLVQGGVATSYPVECMPPAPFPIAAQTAPLLNETTVNGPYDSGFAAGAWVTGGDTGFESTMGEFVNLTCGGWNTTEGSWAMAVLLPFPDRWKMQSVFGWRLPNEEGIYHAPQQYPSWQRGDATLTLSPVTISIKEGPEPGVGYAWDPSVVNPNYIQGGWSWSDQGGAVQLYALGPSFLASDPDLGVAPYIGSGWFNPNDIGNNDSTLLSIMTGTFVFGWDELPAVIGNTAIGGPDPSTGQWGSQIMPTTLIPLGLTMAAIREQAFASGSGTWTQFYYIEEMSYSAVWTIPAYDTYYGQPPGRGVAKIKTLDGSWRELGGATWNTQNDYPVIQQAMLRVNDGWAKEEDTWYPQTSDTRPVYMKTADGWALAWYAGNINAASSPVGTNTTGSTGGGTGTGGGGGGGTGGGTPGGTDPSATGHPGDIYNPWSGYSISGSWQDHMSYSAGGIDYPLGYGTRLAAPAAGTLHTSGGSGEFAAGWVGSAGRRSVLYLDNPMPRVNPNLEQNEGSGPMVAIVLQHQSAFGNNGQHYGKGDYCGMSGASANGSDYGGQTHLHVHGLNASGQRVDFLNYV